MFKIELTFSVHFVIWHEKKLLFYDEEIDKISCIFYPTFPPPLNHTHPLVPQDEPGAGKYRIYLLPPVGCGKHGKSIEG